VHGKVVSQLEGLSALLRTHRKNGLDKEKENELNRLAITSLLVHDVHNRDVLSDLMLANVTTISEWEWQGQLRYYLEDDKCVVRMVQSTFEYGCEYIGNTSRLVLTPLTDRAYRCDIAEWECTISTAYTNI
jgi:dynein heavy chain